MPKPETICVHCTGILVRALLKLGRYLLKRLPFAYKGGK